MTGSAVRDRPAHIPQERVRDVDIYDLPGSERDVHDAWMRLAGEHDLVWSPRNGGHWIATGGELIVRLFRGEERLSNREISVPPGTMLKPVFPIMADGEAHLAYRALIEPAFRPAALAGYTKHARELAIAIIDRLEPRGQCEFIADFATVLPIVIFLKIVDLPDGDRTMLSRHARVLTHDPDLARRQGAYTAINDYLAEKIAERRADPGDDLLSSVIHSQVMGRPATADEIQGTANLLLFGGLDTVTSMMGFAMKFLAANPQHRRWIIDNPRRLAEAVEEIMRRHGVSQLMRTAVADIELDGTPVKAGELIMLPTSLAGLDPRAFDDPRKVDFERRDRGAAATFGAGPHRCPGASLARMEMQIMVEEWLRRIPEFEIDPARPLRQRSGAVNAVLALPLRWPEG